MVEGDGGCGGCGVDFKGDAVGELRRCFLSGFLLGSASNALVDIGVRVRLV